MKLTLEHLAPYLPYGLKMVHKLYKTEGQKGKARIAGSWTMLEDKKILFTYKGQDDWRKANLYLPILRPLSDLTKEIEHKGEKVRPDLWLNRNLGVGWNPDLGVSPYSGWVSLDRNIRITQKLFEWHFDVFNLIESGLAVDKNEI